MKSNEVYLYHLTIDYQHTLDDSSLSSEEKSRAQRFIKTDDQQRFRFCYIHLRKFLAEHLGINAKEINFKRNPYGKPYIDEKQNAKGIHFNLSHSKHHFLLGVALHNIGVDIEDTQRTNDINDIAKHSFSAQEYAGFCCLSEEQKPAAFYKAWTCKEAFIKAIGMGMHFPLKHFSIVVNPNTTAKILQINDNKLAQQPWSITHKQVDQQTQLAIVENKASPSTLIWR